MTDTRVRYSGGPDTMNVDAFTNAIIEILGFHGIDTMEDEEAVRVEVQKLADEKGQNGVLLKITFELVPLNTSEHINT